MKSTLNPGIRYFFTNTDILIMKNHIFIFSKDNVLFSYFTHQELIPNVSVFVDVNGHPFFTK